VPNSMNQSNFQTRSPNFWTQYRSIEPFPELILRPSIFVGEAIQNVSQKKCQRNKAIKKTVSQN
jgi:hypothetical protein